MHYKSKQFFFVLLKLALVFGAFYVIYLKCFKSDTLSWFKFTETLLKSNILKSSNILILLALSVLNWFLEIKKWQLLVADFIFISFFEAFKQSMSSLTSSLITPSRIGEYGAKALYFKKTHSKSILALNLIGNLSQLFWSLFFGVFGLFFVYNNYTLKFQIKNKTLVFLIIIVIILGIGFYWIYKKLKPKITILRISKQRVIKTFSLAVARYIVFSCQFYIILLFFKIKLPYLDIFAFISGTYLLASVVPVISLFDVVLKGSVAVFLFDLATINPLIVLSTVLIMWLLNFAVPAIIGVYFVFSYSPKSVIT